MAQLGKVYKNYMVDVQLSNEKLIDRGVRIVCETIGCTRAEAVSLIQSADGQIKTAIVMGKKGCSKSYAKALLDKADGRIEAV